MAASEETGPGSRPPAASQSRIEALLESLEKRLRRILQEHIPQLESLGYFVDLATTGHKVVAEVDLPGTYSGCLTIRSPEALRRLTPREQEIALLVRDGKSNKEIARKLKISLPTVDTHLRRIFVKLNVHSRVLLAEHIRFGT